MSEHNAADYDLNYWEKRYSKARPDSSHTCAGGCDWLSKAP